MRKFILGLAITSTLLGCDQIEDKENDKNSADKVPVVLPDILDFHGYVQTAFKLNIDGVDFNDSEHFYTNFRKDLVIKNRPDLVDADIEILGEYGHTTFGTGAPVFIAPMNDLGHLFESRTDTERHFKLSVNKDEYLLDSSTQYKSKIMLRIGLVIDGAKSCLLLHSTKDNIVFEEKRPIIFDTFTTQLNEWECDSETMNSTYEDIKAGTIEEVAAPTAEPLRVLYPVELDVTSLDDVLLSFGEPSSKTTEFTWIYTTAEVCQENTNCVVRFNPDTKVLNGHANIKEELLKKK